MVNLDGGINKLGAYHARETVFIGTASLATLPTVELRAGIAEAIKISVAPHVVPACIDLIAKTLHKVDGPEPIVLVFVLDSLPNSSTTRAPTRRARAEVASTPNCLADGFRAPATPTAGMPASGCARVRRPAS